MSGSSIHTVARKRADELYFLRLSVITSLFCNSKYCNKNKICMKASKSCFVLDFGKAYYHPEAITNIISQQHMQRNIK